jgi:hypothetical protein
MSNTDRIELFNYRAHWFYSFTLSTSLYTLEISYIVFKHLLISFQFKNFVLITLATLFSLPLIFFFFFVKDLQAHNRLLEGKSENRLYPLWLGRNKFHEAKAFTDFLGIRTSFLI